MDEALGLFHVFQWISDMQFDYINFVLDSKTTMDAFHMNRVDVVVFGHVITTCENFLSLSLQTKVKFNTNKQMRLSVIL